MKKISVIVPIYNTGDFLAECIDSILNQTFKDWELILVNDGSPDNSAEICKTYIQKDKRIHYYYQKNQGVSVARNLGLSKAKGEYLYCMDSDDSLAPDFLETSYQTAVQNDADIAVIGKWFKEHLSYPPTALPTCAMMIKKAFLNKYPDIRYPIGIQPCEDGLFSHQLLALTDKIAFNPKGVYYYRQHQRSNHYAINKTCGKVLNQIPKWFGILTNFYNQYQLWNTKALHLLKFLEHEPFELRLCSMPFNKQQKEQLFYLIKDFYQTNLKKYITKKDINSMTHSFQILLGTTDFDKFQSRYRALDKKIKIKLFLVRLIPIAKIRRRLRKKIKEMRK